MSAQFERARRVADAILYGGHDLHPVPTVFPAGRHRFPSSAGVLAPREWVEHNLPLDTGIDGSTQSWFARTECVAECPPGTTLTVRLRFLQPQRRTVERYVEGTGFVPADRLDIDGEVVVSGEEPVPQEREVSVLVESLLAKGQTTIVTADEASETELIRDRSGQVRGRIRRNCPSLQIALILGASDAGVVVPLVRLRAVVENVTPIIAPELPPLFARWQSMLATHLLVGLSDGGFVSMLTPPAWARDAASACANIHSFPVLAGEEGRDDLMLSAPVALVDYPRGEPVTLGEVLDAAAPVTGAKESMNAAPAVT